MLANGKSYTEAQLLQRIMDKEAVKAVMNRRVFYQMQGKHQEELDDLWVQDAQLRSTASFAKNFGWYVGMEEIARYYVTGFRQRTSLVGYSFLSPTSTPLVQIAEDGKTAQGLWYTIGQETTTDRQGSSALWFGEKLAADFVKEDGTWKLWHLVIANDYVTPPGKNHSDQPLYFAPGEGPVEKEFGTPTISQLVHDSTLHWADNYPPMPVPYQSYSDEMGYGPKGWRTEIIKPNVIMGLPEVKGHA